MPTPDCKFKGMTNLDISNSLLLQTLSDRSDEFMLIACDGIWNVLSSHAAVSFVREQIAEARASDKCSKTWLSDIAGQVTGVTARVTTRITTTLTT